jgi:hypothetical protein
MRLDELSTRERSYRDSPLQKRKPRRHMGCAPGGQVVGRGVRADGYIVRAAAIRY